MYLDTRDVERETQHGLKSRINIRTSDTCMCIACTRCHSMARQCLLKKFYSKWTAKRRFVRFLTSVTVLHPMVMVFYLESSGCDVVLSTKHFGCFVQHILMVCVGLCVCMRERNFAPHTQNTDTQTRWLCILIHAFTSKYANIKIMVHTT